MLDQKSSSYSITSPDNKESARIRRHNNSVKESTIIKSLLVVVLVFFICMTPFSVTKLIKVCLHRLVIHLAEFLGSESCE